MQVACRLLEVTDSGYYAWRSRAPSQRALRHAWLTEQIRAVHTPVTEELAQLPAIRIAPRSRIVRRDQFTRHAADRVVLNESAGHLHHIPIA